MGERRYRVGHNTVSVSDGVSVADGSRYWTVEVLYRDEWGVVADWETVGTAVDAAELVSLVGVAWEVAS